jgi:hypothetical protein
MAKQRRPSRYKKISKGLTVFDRGDAVVVLGSYGRVMSITAQEIDALHAWWQARRGLATKGKS